MAMKDWNLQEQVFGDDFDRALAIRFAPQNKRQGLYLLAALKGELSRIGQQTTEPLLGQIKIQFWREALYEKRGAGLKLASQIIEHFASHPDFFVRIDSLLYAYETALLETEAGEETSERGAGCQAALFALSSIYIDPSLQAVDKGFFLQCGEVQDGLARLGKTDLKLGKTELKENGQKTEVKVKSLIRKISQNYQALCQDLSVMPEGLQAGILPLALVPSYLHLYQAPEKKGRMPTGLHPVKKAFLMWRAMRSGLEAL